MISWREDLNSFSLGLYTLNLKHLWLFLYTLYHRVRFYCDASLCFTFLFTASFVLREGVEAQRDIQGFCAVVWLVDWLIVFCFESSPDFFVGWYEVVTKYRSDELLKVVLCFGSSVINLQYCSGMVSLPYLVWLQSYSSTCQTVGAYGLGGIFTVPHLLWHRPWFYLKNYPHKMICGQDKAQSN